MAIEAIQKNNTNNSGKMSVAGSATIGALAGYTLKCALPITPQEKDERYNLELKKINKEARLARNAEKEIIAKLESKPDGVDKFIKMNKKGTLTFNEIEKLKEPEKANVKALFSRINKASFRVKADGRKALKAFTKSIRPTSTFIFAGMAVAAGIAFLHNIINIIKQDSQQDYDY